VNDERSTCSAPGVVVTNKAFAGHPNWPDGTAGGRRGSCEILRTGVEMPVTVNFKLERGDTLTLAGSRADVERVAPIIGYADRATEETDMVVMGAGIVIGALLGALTFELGGVPLSLSTSGGALIAGLVCGWLRSVNRTFGRIPAPALWVFNNIGLRIPSSPWSASAPGRASSPGCRPRACNCSSLASWSPPSAGHQACWWQVRVQDEAPICLGCLRGTRPRRRSAPSRPGEKQGPAAATR
jgi:hypothetical protein